MHQPLSWLCCLPCGFLSSSSSTLLLVVFLRCRIAHLYPLPKVFRCSPLPSEQSRHFSDLTQSLMNWFLPVSFCAFFPLPSPALPACTNCRFLDMLWSVFFLVLFCMCFLLMFRLFFLPCCPLALNFPKPSDVVRCSLVLSWSLCPLYLSNRAYTLGLFHWPECLLLTLHCLASQSVSASVLPSALHNIRYMSAFRMLVK